MTSPLLASDEPPAFDIVRPDGKSDFLFTCDHASNRIPRALGDLGVSEAERARHIGWDIGAAATARLLAERLDAFLILQNYSRLVIDCNRPAGSATLIPEISEATEIPGNLGLSPDDVALRRAAIFTPYHERTVAELAARRAAGRRTVLVTMHSYTPVYLAETRRVQCGVLYNRDARLAHRLRDLLQQEPGPSPGTNLVVGDNEPYSVNDFSDYAIPVYGEQGRLPHVEFEIRQDLIGHPAGQAEWAERLARLLPLAADGLS